MPGKRKKTEPSNVSLQTAWKVQWCWGAARTIPPGQKSWNRAISVCLPSMKVCTQILICTQRPRGLAGLQHWGRLVVEHDRRDCRKYCLYALFSGLGFRAFRVLRFRVLGFKFRRLGNTKTLALRSFWACRRIIFEHHSNLTRKPYGLAVYVYCLL